MKQYAISVFFGFLLAVLPSSFAFAQDANDVAGNIVDSVSLLPGLVAGFLYLSGVLFAINGIFRTIEHVTNPRDNPLRVPIVRFLIGGALFSFPIVLEAVVTAINGGTATTFDPTTEMITLVNALFTDINAIFSLNTNINGVFNNISSSIDQIPGLISAVSYLLALVIAASALYKTRDHVEDPKQFPLKDAVIRYLLAGSLLALPTVYEAMYTTIADSGLGFGGVLSSFASGFNFFFSSETSTQECLFSATSITAGISGGTLGTVVCNTFANTSGFPIFLTSISYLIGLVFGVWGLFKIRDHVTDPTRTGLNEGIMRLIAGGAFFAFPYLTIILKTTILPTPLAVITIATTNSTFNETPGLLGCTSIPGAGALFSGPSLDQAMGCFVNDLLGPTHIVLNFFATVAGMIFIMIGISRLIKSSQEGARGPGGLGTIGTFVIGGVLMSATTILRAFSSSMFGNPVTDTFAQLTYTVGMSVTETQAAHNVISAVLKFMIILGMISFVRGIFIMRDVAEGKQQASTMAGMTHMIGGALAVNLGPLMNAVQSTLGINGFGVTFLAL